MLEYSLAKTALAYSKALARPTDPDDSQKLTAMVLRSQEYYDQAEKFFDKENYEEAEKYFRLSRILSEKAENFFHIKYPGANQ